MTLFLLVLAKAALYTGIGPGIAIAIFIERFSARTVSQKGNTSAQQDGNTFARIFEVPGGRQLANALGKFSTDGEERRFATAEDWATSLPSETQERGVA